MTVWTMKQIFSGKVPQTNEEFVQYIKKRDRLLILLPIAGALLLALGLCGEWLGLPIPEYMCGFYTGAGTGLIGAAIVMGIKHRRLIRDEEKIKKARLEMSDERLRTISKAAFRMAAIVLMAAMYLIAFIGGIFYPILTAILLVMVFIFLLAYAIAYHVFEKMM